MKCEKSMQAKLHSSIDELSFMFVKCYITIFSLGCATAIYVSAKKHLRKSLHILHICCIINSAVRQWRRSYSEVAQWWSNRLLTGRLWVRAPPSEPIRIWSLGFRFSFIYCRSGGTGRRTGLKILRSLPSVPVRSRSPAPVISAGSINE